MPNKLLYTSDMHGNEKQFRAFADYALEIKPSVVIIGGELLPNSVGRFVEEDYPKTQRYFLMERLPCLLNPIKWRLPNTKIFVTPGNDDCIINDDVLNAYSDLFTNIDGKRLPLSKKLEIVGYSYVPITPFGIKDREKFDLTNVSKEVAQKYAERQKGYNLHGVVSVKKDNVKVGKFGWKEFSFIESDKVNSIQKDLEDKLYTTNHKKTIYVIHTPPSHTPLDITGNHRNVGSFAVREFIENYQPYLTLHGHIHETVDMSGNYKTQIGKTWCMSAGNHNEDSKLAVLVIDLDNISNVKRVKLPCTAFGKFLKEITSN